MENVSKAFIMAFSMIMFVIAFSYSMYLINKLTTTSNTLLESVSTTNYYDNIKVTGEVNERDVGIDTIIPTLYRYYKENYAVKIVIRNASGQEELLQLFDLNIETKIARAAANKDTSKSELESLRRSIYNNKGNPYTPTATNVEKAYLFEAPWTANTKEDARARIDYFLNGTKGYINDGLIDYSKNGPTFNQEGGFIAYCKNSAGTSKTFRESFVEYAYEGETISTENRSRNNNWKYARKFKNYYNLYRTTIKMKK